jgi:hypothetical protein
VNAEVREHLERSKEFLDAADALLASGFPSVAVGRAYYAMFHAAMAALLERGIIRSSHHALIAAFGQFLVKPGVVPPHFHAWLREVFELRSDTDYSATSRLTPEMARQVLARARAFVEICRELCEMNAPGPCQPVEESPSND